MRAGNVPARRWRAFKKLWRESLCGSSGFWPRGGRSGAGDPGPSIIQHARRLRSLSLAHDAKSDREITEGGWLGATIGGTISHGSAAPAAAAQDAGRAGGWSLGIFHRRLGIVIIGVP